MKSICIGHYYFHQFNFCLRFIFDQLLWWARCRIRKFLHIHGLTKSQRVLSSCFEVMFGWTVCAAHGSQGDVLACVVCFASGCDDFDVSRPEESSWSFSTVHAPDGARIVSSYSYALIFIIWLTLTIAILNMYVILLLLVPYCLLYVEFRLRTFPSNSSWNYLQIWLLVFQLKSNKISISAWTSWLCSYATNIIVYYLISKLLSLRSTWVRQSRHIYLNVRIGLWGVHLMNYELTGILAQGWQTYDRLLSLLLLLNHTHTFMPIFEKAIWLIDVGLNSMVRCLLVQNVARDAWACRL